MDFTSLSYRSPRFFLVCSFCFHIAFLFFVALWTPEVLSYENEQPVQKTIKARLVSLPEFFSTDFQSEPLKFSKSEEPFLKDKQIVEVPNGPDEPPPDHAKYLAERNMRAEKETQAPPGKPVAGHLAGPVPAEGEYGEAEQRNGGVGDFASKLGSGLYPSFYELWQQTSKKEGKGNGTSGNGVDKKIGSVIGSEFEISRGGPGSIDYIEGAITGEVTQLNAYKFEHAAFFNQLKRTVAFYWNPSNAIMYVPRNYRTLETQVKMVLNSDGTLADAEVIKSSGFSMVDQASIRALKRATPVFNVPKELLNQNQQLEINWGFYIIIN